MTISFIATALLIVTVVTNFTVEGIKKVLDGFKKTYSSNVLAAIVSVIVALIVSSIYIATNQISITVTVILEVFVTMYLGFLTSTIGYDKVMQMLGQITGVKPSYKKDE